MTNRTGLSRFTVTLLALLLACTLGRGPLLGQTSETVAQESVRQENEDLKPVAVSAPLICQNETVGSVSLSVTATGGKNGLGTVSGSASYERESEQTFGVSKVTIGVALAGDVTRRMEINGRKMIAFSGSLKNAGSYRKEYTPNDGRVVEPKEATAGSGISGMIAGDSVSGTVSFHSSEGGQNTQFTAKLSKMANPSDGPKIDIAISGLFGEHEETDDDALAALLSKPAQVVVTLTDAAGKPMASKDVVVFVNRFWHGSPWVPLATRVGEDQIEKFTQGLGKALEIRPENVLCYGLTNKNGQLVETYLGGWMDVDELLSHFRIHHEPLETPLGAAFIEIAGKDFKVHARAGTSLRLEGVARLKNVLRFGLETEILRNPRKVRLSRDGQGLPIFHPADKPAAQRAQGTPFYLMPADTLYLDGDDYIEIEWVGGRRTSVRTQAHLLDGGDMAKIAIDTRNLSGAAGRAVYNATRSNAYSLLFYDTVGLVAGGLEAKGAIYLAGAALGHSAAKLADAGIPIVIEELNP